MIQIEISDFPEYEDYPAKGRTVRSDSKVFDLEFDKEGLNHSVKILVELVYHRYYEPGDNTHPGEDFSRMTGYDFTLIKAWKYPNVDEIEIKDPKELRRLEAYITENIEFI